MRSGMTAGRLCAVAAVIMFTSACSSPPRENESPGTNERIGALEIRNVHFDEPPDDDAYPVGSDIHMYAWFYNNGDRTALVEVSSPIAAEVEMAPEGELPVAIPPRQLVSLGRGDDHLVLRDIRREVGGHEFVPVELVFEQGVTIELRVEPVDVDLDEQDMSE